MKKIKENKDVWNLILQYLFGELAFQHFERKNIEGCYEGLMKNDKDIKKLYKTFRLVSREFSQENIPKYVALAIAAYQLDKIPEAFFKKCDAIQMPVNWYQFMRTPPLSEEMDRCIETITCLSGSVAGSLSLWCLSSLYAQGYEAMMSGRTLWSLDLACSMGFKGTSALFFSCIVPGIFFLRYMVKTDVILDSKTVENGINFFLFYGNFVPDSEKEKFEKIYISFDNFIRKTAQREYYEKQQSRLQNIGLFGGYNNKEHIIDMLNNRMLKN